MRKSNDLLNKVAQAAAGQNLPSNDLPIEAGHQGSDHTQNPADSEQARKNQGDKIDAINRIFVELELAYHNQYHKAFPNEQSVSMAKQLWHDALRAYSPEVTLKACRNAIADSEYLPSLHKLNKHCQQQFSAFGLPDALDAYREACNAPSPKNIYAWSHPAVYFAGKASDWFLMSSEPEGRMLPRFETHYQKLCERVLNGEQLLVPAPKLIPDSVPSKVLAADEQHEKMEAMRKKIDI